MRLDEHRDMTTLAIYNVMATLGVDGRTAQALGGAAMNPAQAEGGQAAIENPFTGLANELQIEAGRTLSDAGSKELALYLEAGLAEAVDQDAADFYTMLQPGRDESTRTFMDSVAAELRGDLLPHILEENARGRQLAFRTADQPAHARPGILNRGTERRPDVELPVAVRRAELRDRQPDARMERAVDLTDFRAGDRVNFSMVQQPDAPKPVNTVISGFVSGFRQVDCGEEGKRWGVTLRLDGVEARYNYDLMHREDALRSGSEVCIVGARVESGEGTNSRFAAGETPAIFMDNQPVSLGYTTPAGDQTMRLNRVTINQLDMFEVRTY
jgi:hypothetical protein